MAVMIRNLAAANIAAATDLQHRVYKTVPAFQAEQFKSLPDRFSKGLSPGEAGFHFPAKTEI